MRTIIASLALVSAPAMASIYYDAEGDIATGNANLDILMAEVTHSSSSVTISMTVSDLSVDWGKYMVIIDAGISGGDGSNPWGRDISLGGGLNADFAIGSWLDNGGGTTGLMQWDTAWGSFADVDQTVDWENDTVTWTIDGAFLTILETSGMGSFQFDIISTGGGTTDPAIDFMGGEGVQPGWGQGSGMTDMFTYTLPSPGALALLGLAGICSRRRRR